MKIILVLRSLKMGGAEKHTLDLMRGLRKRGHMALYAGPMRGWLGQQAQAEGFEGIDLPMSGLFDLPSLIRLALYARRQKADLIHGHLTRGAWYAGWGAKLAGTACVATAHSDNAGKHFGRADKVIAVSRAVADFLQGCGYDSGRIRPIHHGITDFTAGPQTCSRMVMRQQLGLPDDEPCLLMAARFVEAKGHDVALQALSRLRDRPWTLLLAGDHQDDLGPATQAQAERLGISARIRFLGVRDDIPDLMRAADVLLAPSRREALSLTLLEASAASLPVVASRVGGIVEVVDDGASGFLVSPNDPDELARMLILLLDDRALRHVFGLQARERFLNRFTEDLMFAQTIDTYREACSS